MKAVLYVLLRWSLALLAGRLFLKSWSLDFGGLVVRIRGGTARIR